ncbi:hypothetical protein TrVE_jg6990 [Triparma verrucosa]|uniref:VLRF1 domain-containing protein n=1 Tax=Triparma verrucosa TaxID=1606542 RepID=A0A9W7BCM2_9STRA|nr:hypothetical protein TrVE_jg6990 [Triparma verrucosa]
MSKSNNPYQNQIASDYQPPLPKRSISQIPYYILPLQPPPSPTVLQFSPILFPTSPPPTLSTLAPSLASLKTSRIAIVLLRSGSLSYGIFSSSKKLLHKSQKRYTVRKGQGGAQSSADGGKNIKSIGSQLRRDGEKKLRDDCKAIPVREDDIIIMGCSKVMRKNLLEDLKSPPASNLRTISGKWDDSQKGVDEIYERITTYTQREAVQDDLGWSLSLSSDENESSASTPPPSSPSSSSSEEDTSPAPIPYTPLHLSVLSSSPPQLPSPYLDFRAGPQLFTPLHAAASINNLPACLSLLETGASPFIEDGRGRMPWDIACAHNATLVKECLKTFRAENSEMWDWSVTRIPEPTDGEVLKERERRKKVKDKEKKKRQKEKKKKEKEQAEISKKAKESEESEKIRLEKFKREKVHLNTSATGERQCDFCGCEVRYSKDLFRRDEWKYCKTECLQKHRREIMAKAAERRFGGT